MNVLYTTDLSRECTYTDHSVYESITLFEQFGVYFVLNVWSVDGYPLPPKVDVLITTTSFAEALVHYIKAGGQASD